MREIDLEQLLNDIYRIYKDDLKEEDSPPKAGNLPFKKGDIVELNANIYVYLWKETDYGYLGLLATPYTLLAHPSHPNVKTDGLLYEVMAITDLYIPLREETIRKYLTDVIHITEPTLEVLNEKIAQMVKRKKIYHPIRERFLREEAKRTAFLIEEYFQGIEKEKETTQGAIVLKLPKRVLESQEIPYRLAAESEQETAENDQFLIVKQTDNLYSLIVKDPSLLGRKVKILFGKTPIYEGLIDTETLMVEVDGDISPTALADLLKVEE